MSSPDPSLLGWADWIGLLRFCLEMVAMLFVCACFTSGYNVFSGVDPTVAPDGGFKDVVVRWCGPGVPTIMRLK